MKILAKPELFVWFTNTLIKLFRLFSRVVFAIPIQREDPEENGNEKNMQNNSNFTVKIVEDAKKN